jgi:hypothetical protein
MLWDIVTLGLDARMQVKIDQYLNEAIDPSLPFEEEVQRIFENDERFRSMVTKQQERRHACIGVWTFGFFFLITKLLI